MRKAAAILLALLFVAPAVAAELPHASASDGALSVVDGRGEITLGMRTGMVGGVIGRIDKGCVAITDLSPEDSTSRSSGATTSPRSTCRAAA